jgi:uncharacterized protein YbbK (DUF523 family)
MKLVSACLVGINCSYDCKNRANEKLLKLFKKGELIPVCPEQLGGQNTPRPNAEIWGGTGADVLDGKARVIEEDGYDVTDYFIKGAHEVLNIAKKTKAKEVIFKERSPSCGLREIYNGKFINKLIKGSGVTTALLKRHGITIKSDEEI